MNQYKLVTFMIAVAVAACFVGVGIAIAEKSTWGTIACLIGSIGLMGAGFSYKRKHLR